MILWFSEAITQCFIVMFYTWTYMTYIHTYIRLDPWEISPILTHSKYRWVKYNNTHPYLTILIIDLLLYVYILSLHCVKIWTWKYKIFLLPRPIKGLPPHIWFFWFERCGWKNQNEVKPWIGEILVFNVFVVHNNPIDTKISNRYYQYLFELNVIF